MLLVSSLDVTGGYHVTMGIYVDVDPETATTIGQFQVSGDIVVGKNASLLIKQVDDPEGGDKAHAKGEAAYVVLSKDWVVGPNPFIRLDVAEGGRLTFEAPVHVSGDQLVRKQGKGTLEFLGENNFYRGDEHIGMLSVDNGVLVTNKAGLTGLLGITVSPDVSDSTVTWIIKDDVQSPDLAEVYVGDRTVIEYDNTEKPFSFGAQTSIKSAGTNVPTVITKRGPGAWSGASFPDENVGLVVHEDSGKVTIKTGSKLNSTESGVPGLVANAVVQLSAVSVHGLTGTGEIVLTGTNTITDAGKFDGTLSGTGDVTVDATAGDIVHFAGTNNHMGVTYVKTGVLDLGKGLVNRLPGNVGVAPGAALRLNTELSNEVSFDYQSGISVDVVGTLSGTINYLKGTSVQADKALLNKSGLGTLVLAEGVVGQINKVGDKDELTIAISEGALRVDDEGAFPDGLGKDSAGKNLKQDTVLTMSAGTTLQTKSGLNFKGVAVTFGDYAIFKSTLTGDNEETPVATFRKLTAGESGGRRLVIDLELGEGLAKGIPYKIFSVTKDVLYMPSDKTKYKIQVGGLDFTDFFKVGYSEGDTTFTLELLGDADEIAFVPEEYEYSLVESDLPYEEKIEVTSSSPVESYTVTPEALMTGVDGIKVDWDDTAGAFVLTVDTLPTEPVKFTLFVSTEGDIAANVLPGTATSGTYTVTTPGLPPEPIPDADLFSEIPEDQTLDASAPDATIPGVIKHADFLVWLRAAIDNGDSVVEFMPEGYMEEYRPLAADTPGFWDLSLTEDANGKYTGEFELKLLSLPEPFPYEDGLQWRFKVTDGEGEEQTSYWHRIDKEKPIDEGFEVGTPVTTYNTFSIPVGYRYGGALVERNVTATLVAKDDDTAAYTALLKTAAGKTVTLTQKEFPNLVVQADWEYAVTFTMEGSEETDFVSFKTDPAPDKKGKVTLTEVKDKTTATSFAFTVEYAVAGEKLKSVVSLAITEDEKTYYTAQVESGTTVDTTTTKFVSESGTPLTLKPKTEYIVTGEMLLDPALWDGDKITIKTLEATPGGGGGGGGCDAGFAGLALLAVAPLFLRKKSK
jgi:Synergist-CTERM protein sorting domain-containing protein